MAGKNEPFQKLQHIAIIMDGNKRWAEKRGLNALEGHKAGAKAVQRTMEACKDFNIKYLTLYAFSTENWNRPKYEIQGLMTLLKQFINDNIDRVDKEGICVRAIGRLKSIPEVTRKTLFTAIERTKNNTGGTVILALNYGGRAEIVDAAKKIFSDVAAGKFDIDNLTEKKFGDYLYAPDIPDPDMIIRTSGEFRISNFLLWELSYSELWITDTLWPDFGKDEIKKAIDVFYKRERRYGSR